MGRPTKLTEERRREICDLLRKGNPIRVACEMSGISEASYHAWRSRGQKECNRIEEGHANCSVRQSEAPFVEFLEETTRARAEGEQYHVSNIKKHSAEDWRASAWLLERMHSDRYSKMEKREISGEGGGPVRTEVVIVNKPQEDDGDAAD